MAVAGVTSIEVNVTAGGKTVKLAWPDLPPKAAVMFAVPAVTAVARPDVLMTVAMPGAPELQVALLLMSWLVLSE